MTVIAPIWPTAPWFPQLFLMSTTQPVLLPNKGNLFLTGLWNDSNLVNNLSWRVDTFNISGQVASTRGYQAELSRLLQEKTLTQGQLEHISLLGGSLQCGLTTKVFLTMLFRQIDW